MHLSAAAAAAATKAFIFRAYRLYSCRLQQDPAENLQGYPEMAKLWCLSPGRLLSSGHHAASKASSCHLSQAFDPFWYKCMHYYCTGLEVTWLCMASSAAAIHTYAIHVCLQDLGAIGVPGWAQRRGRQHRKVCTLARPAPQIGPSVTPGQCCWTLLDPASCDHMKIAVCR